MPITQGLTNVGSIFIGETPIASVYQGTNLLYQSEITYELLYELDVTTAATQIDIEDLNITKDDEVRLVYTFVGDNSSTNNDISLFPNGLTTATNYYRQALYGSGTTLTAERHNNAIIIFARSNAECSGFADIKVSNNNRFVLQDQHTRIIGSDAAGIFNFNTNVIGTQTVSSITKLSIVGSRTNGIAVGSKIQLYKVSGGTS